jgi:multidrug efflux pump subunit AcrA (membrane-fusion protein)
MAALVVAFALTGCSDTAASPIAVAPVGRSTVVEVVDAPATVEAAATATVTAPAAGTVRRLLVRDGQRVRAGQVLLVINSPQTLRTLQQAQQAAAAVGGGVSLSGVDLSAGQSQADAAASQAFAAARQAARQIPDPTQRQQALAQIAQTQAQYAAARAQVQATVGQINSGVANLEQALSALTTAQRTQAQLAVAAAQRAVDALAVRAPITGTVVLGAGASDGSGSSDLSGLLDQVPSGLQGQAQSLLGSGSSGSGGSTTGQLGVGSPVSSGDPLLTVTDVSSLSLTAQVDETDVLLVHKGVPADVQLDAVPGAVYRAVVRNVDLNPTTSSRGGVAYVTRLALFEGRMPDGSVAPQPRPGMSAVASLRVRTARDAVAVPAAAVFRDGTQDAVWLVTDGEAHKQTVTLGAQGQDTVQVVSGVSEGDEVVVKGADQVRDGQQVP